jgi:hypothetical protein
MKTIRPNPSPLFKNNTKRLSVYTRINLRNIACITTLGETLLGLSFVDK